MGYDRFEMTDTDLQFERARLGALLDVARERGYLQDHDPEEADSGVDPEITILDFTQGDRDIYDIIFDGQGGYASRYLMAEGKPVRR